MTKEKIKITDERLMVFKMKRIDINNLWTQNWKDAKRFFDYEGNLIATKARYKEIWYKNFKDMLMNLEKAIFMRKMPDERTMLRKAVDAETIDLAKLGWTESRDDKQIFSYIRGYIWRNYKVRIKPPLDFIILCMLDDAMDENSKKS